MDRKRYDRMETVFEEAVELEGEARVEFLDRVCAGDAELRRSVEQLLARDRADDELGTGPGLLESAVEPAPRVPAPEKIGHYRITRRIAEGGMGAVYLAEQENPRRQVALKIIHPGLLSEEMLRRFRFEAELLGRLQHPGIAHIHEAGEAETEAGRQPFFAMEYIRGPELREYVKQHELDLDERVELLARVCDAVSHAHQKGIVHRDLKPNNILVVEEPTSVAATVAGQSSTKFARLGQPKVLDFGVSCLAPESASDSAKLTLPGHVIGTPAYMSPEQAAGERTVDTRSDVFSLGVIAFELLSGRLPHDLEQTPLAHALRIVQEQPAPRLESIDRTLRGDLSIIVGKALETERERRYASASGLAEDLRRYLSDQPISARPPTLGYQLGRFVRRNRVLVAGALVAVLGLVVGLVFALLAQRDEARQRVVAEQRTEEARGLTYSAQLQAAMAYGASGDRQAAREQLASTAPELRGWEAEYLRADLEDDLYRIPMEIPRSPTSSPTPGAEKALFPVGRETLRLFDFATGTWTDHPRPAETGEGPESGAVALLPGERRALWGDRSGRLLLLDLEGGEAPRELPRIDGAIEDICVAPNGRRAAVFALGLEDMKRASLHVLDLSSFSITASWEDAPYIACSAFTPDSAQLCLGLAGWSADILLLDAATLERVRSFSGHARGVSALCFSPDGRLLASAGHELAIRTWEVETGREVNILGPVRYVAESLAFHPDGERFLSGHPGARIHCWNVATGECESTTVGRMVPRPEDCPIRQLSFGGGGDRVHAVGLDGVRVRLLGPSLPEVLHHERGILPFASTVAFSPSGRILASGAWDGTVKIWDVATRRLVTTLECPANTLWLAFSPGGDRLLVCSQVGYSSPVLRLFETRSWSSPRESRYGQPSYCGLFVPAAGVVLLGFSVGLRIVDAETLELKEERSTETSIWALALSPDGTRVAYGTGGGRLVILDAATLRPLLEVDAHPPGNEAIPKGIEALAFSPDGARLVTGGDGDELGLWETRTGERLALFEAPGTQNVLSLLYTSDGRRILSGSRSESIGIRDAETGQELLRLHGHRAYVKDLAWSPDGRILASASGDNTVRLWDARPLRERFEERRHLLEAEDAVRARVERLLTEHETLESVLEVIDADPELGPLEKHAAWNLVHRSGR